MNIIEGVERDAVIKLCQTNLIPRQGNWKILESWGITKKETDDPLFYKAELPAGWQRLLCPDNHRAIYIVDEAGKVRVLIFYKSVIYDRKANFSVYS